MSIEIRIATEHDAEALGISDYVLLSTIDNPLNKWVIDLERKVSLTRTGGGREEFSNQDYFRMSFDGQVIKFVMEEESINGVRHWKLLDDQLSLPAVDALAFLGLLKEFLAAYDSFYLLTPAEFDF